MRETIRFEVRDRRIHYSFELRRKVTLLKGDSATGKTSLLELLGLYEREGRMSGVRVETNSTFFVFTSMHEELGWLDVLSKKPQTVIFIDEDSRFVASKEFASYASKSDKYFVIISRRSLKCLPYSIHEIYELQTVKGLTKMVPLYENELYTSPAYESMLSVDTVVTEDSNAAMSSLSVILRISV